MYYRTVDVFHLNGVLGLRDVARLIPVLPTLAHPVDLTDQSESSIVPPVLISSTFLGLAICTVVCSCVLADPCCRAVCHPYTRATQGHLKSEWCMADSFSPPLQDLSPFQATVSCREESCGEGPRPELGRDRRGRLQLVPRQPVARLCTFSLLVAGRPALGSFAPSRTDHGGTRRERSFP